MENYYVNNTAQANGDHEVHKEGCVYLPSIQNRKDLGYHYNCATAVARAKQTYATADGCSYCSNACHTR